MWRQRSNIWPHIQINEFLYPQKPSLCMRKTPGAAGLTPTHPPIGVSKKLKRPPLVISWPWVCPEYACLLHWSKKQYRKSKKIPLNMKNGSPLLDIRNATDLCQDWQRLLWRLSYLAQPLPLVAAQLTNQSPDAVACSTLPLRIRWSVSAPSQNSRKRAPTKIFL